MDKNEKSCKKKTDSLENLDYDFIRSDERNQPAYLKSQNRFKSNNQIILEYSPVPQDTHLWLNKEPLNIVGTSNQMINSTSYKLNSKSVPFEMSFKNSSDYEDEYFKNKNLQLVSRKQPFSNEMCKNLEKMLIKMQNSFDPFKLVAVSICTASSFITISFAFDILTSYI